MSAPRRCWPWAVALAALGAAACPAIDFQNHTFVCANDLDCLYMDDEECLDGFCRKIASACAKSADCASGKSCLQFSYGTRCVSSCSVESDCSYGTVCKLVEVVGTSIDTYATACSMSGGGITNGTCAGSDECASPGACIGGTCRLMCSPGQTTCAGASESCKLGGTGFPASWGYCQ